MQLVNLLFGIGLSAIAVAAVARFGSYGVLITKALRSPQRERMLKELFLSKGFQNTWVEGQPFVRGIYFGALMGMLGFGTVFVALIVASIRGV